MTRWECLAWAQSDEAKGWVVGWEDTAKENGEGWYLPQAYSFYQHPLKELIRARLDGNGVDKSTIQGFEVEEKQC
jgi:hypothetical protein